MFKENSLEYYIVRFVIYLSVVFVPFIHFYGVATFPTWRIFMLLFVLGSVFYFKKVKSEFIPRNFLIVLLLFFLENVFEVLNLVVIERFSLYLLSFYASLLILFAFVFYFYIHLKENFVFISKLIMLSLSMMLMYQLFQFVAFESGHSELCNLLNQEGIENDALFYKVVDGYFAAPSFMSEAGQFSIVLGPLLIFFYLCNHYKILVVNKLLYIFGILGLFLTLSSGAVLQIFFFLLAMLFVNMQKFQVRHLIWIASLSAVTFLVLLVFPTLFELTFWKISTILEGDGPRIQGGLLLINYLDADSVWFGLGQKATEGLNHLGADVNMLIPVLVMEHGIWGVFAFFLIYLVPPFIAFYYSKQKLFIIPLVSMFIHLCLAYGSYLWANYWILYCLVLYGLEYKSVSIHFHKKKDLIES